MTTEEFIYRTDRAAQGNMPGSHRADSAGGGMTFRRHVSLLQSLDPRRIDIRASLHDPFEQILVREHSQNVSIPVYAIADLSASMNAGENRKKLKLLADFSASLAYSAWRTGDPFAFTGCSETILHEFTHPLSHNKNIARVIHEQLHDLQLTGKNSAGLLHATGMLPGRRSLVFLISDYYFSVDLLNSILDSLLTHDIVAVLIEDTQDPLVARMNRRYGIVRALDSETRASRLFFMRPGLARRIRETHAEHRRAVNNALALRGIRPLLLANEFRAQDVSHYFLDRLQA